MGEWQVIPESEIPAVIAATREGRCVACYGAITNGHVGFYCCDCDDLCDHEAAS